MINLKLEKMPKSIGITLRPRMGFTDNDIEKFIKNYKYSSYLGCYAILEKEDNERHLHAIFWWERDVALSNHNTNHWRNIFHDEWVARDESIWSLIVYDKKGKKKNAGAWHQTQIYNDDWYTNYLLGQLNPDGSPKEDPFTVLVDDVPPIEVRSKCYSNIKKRKFRGDELMIKLKKLWDDWSTCSVISKSKIKRFFIESQYKTKTIRVVSQEKQLNERMKCFLAWLTEGESMYESWFKIPWEKDFQKYPVCVCFQMVDQTKWISKIQWQDRENQIGTCGICQKKVPS